MIIKQTRGKGVDFVLNSLSDDKLKASIRCLRAGGVFCDLGLHDIYNNSELGMGMFANGVSFRTVFAHQKWVTSYVRKQIVKLMKEDLARGIIQPLPSTVYVADDIENAFRFLASGKHIGKVLLQIRETEQSVCSLPITVTPRPLFDPRLVYILVGGLGGFGLELADWLVMRGVKNLVLSSRRGVCDEYQRYRIK